MLIAAGADVAALLISPAIIRMAMAAVKTNSGMKKGKLIPMESNCAGKPVTA